MQTITGCRHQNDLIKLVKNQPSPVLSCVPVEEADMVAIETDAVIEHPGLQEDTAEEEEIFSLQQFLPHQNVQGDAGGDRDQQTWNVLVYSHLQLVLTLPTYADKLHC